jgi:hypothetical protein
LLVAAVQSCGGRSDLSDERSCNTPDEFLTREGAPADCRVTEIVA